MAKRPAAWLCVLLMLSPMMTVVSGTDHAPAAGAPSRAEIPIFNAYDLQNMSRDLYASYYLANDIDATGTKDWNGGAGFAPVGNGKIVNAPPYMNPTKPYLFSGRFDGKGHTITGLYINRPSEDFAALFGAINDTIKLMNVSLVDVNVTGKLCTGGLVGEANWGCSVTSCSSSGTVAGSYDVGGLIGEFNGGTISNCYSASNVSGINIVGGLAGMSQGTIYNSYSQGAVTGGYDPDGGIAGFAGYTSSSSVIVNCYSTGKVTGSGIVGAFSAGTWYGLGTWSNCFWDNQTSGQTWSSGGAGRNTTDMMKRATFTGWNFTSPWKIIENRTYPFLLDFYEYPAVIGPEEVTVKEDSPVSAHYDASISVCPSVNNFTWSLSTNAGGWLSFSASTGNLSGTPDNSEVGSYWVNLTATDLVGSETSCNLTLTVENVLPVFTTVPPPNGLSVDQDQELSFDVGCDDEGMGGTSYGLAKAPAWLALGPANGTLSGRPGNGDVGRHSIALFADDGWGGRTNLSFDISVADVNDPPVIASPDIKSAMQGVRYNSVYQATDIDPVKETFTWSVETDAGWLTMDGQTGLLSGVPANADVGDWWVNVTVDDGRGGNGSSNFTLTVANVNDPPVITTEPSALATQGAEYRVQFNATDIDAGDALNWSLDTTADWLSMNSTSGVLGGTPAENDVGQAWVGVTVTDAAGAEDSAGFLLTVQNVNDPPFWVSKAPDQNLTEGSMLLLDVLASDPDAGDSIQYLISSAPQSGISINPVSGAIRWTGAVAGNYTVTVTASDGALSVPAVFNLTVNRIVAPPPPANKHPVIGQAANASVKAGQTLSLKLTGTDADAYDAVNLTFRLLSGPAGMVVSADGSLVWTPTKEQAGTHAVSVSLSDGKNATISAFSVTVAKPAAAASASDNSMGLMIGLLVLGLVIGAVAAYALGRKPPAGPSEKGKEEKGAAAEEE